MRNLVLCRELLARPEIFGRRRGRAQIGPVSFPVNTPHEPWDYNVVDQAGGCEDEMSGPIAEISRDWKNYNL